MATITIKIKESAFAVGGRFYGIPRHKVFIVIPINELQTYVGANMPRRYYTDQIYAGALNMVLSDNQMEIPDYRWDTMGVSDIINNIKPELSHLVRMNIIEVRKDDVILTEAGVSGITP